MTVVLRPQAIEDIRAAKQYYDREQAGLGEKLRGAFDVVFERLQTFPRSAPVVAGFPGVRRALVVRFPYAVFYTTGASGIVVLRILHTARDPKEWPSGLDQV